ncbi:hypothetical protein EPU08_14800 [Escherichia coli]|nr:hypothetical protein EPU31_14565 [Escherichia coli]RWV41626.1 hypothetical protein EPU08_14800 [Escherichia coli]
MSNFSLAALIAETRSCGGAFAARGSCTRCSSTATRKPLPCKPQQPPAPPCRRQQWLHQHFALFIP